MADLNIRNIPDDVMAHIKAKAAQARMTLRDYCIGKLNTGASVQLPPEWPKDSSGELMGIGHAPYGGVTVSGGKWKHDKANCHVYGCLMCEEAQ